MKITYTLLFVSIFFFIFSHTVSAKLVDGIEVGLWIPYWHKDDGTAYLLDNMSSWDEASLFSVEVNNDATLKHTMDFSVDPWKSFIETSHKNGNQVITTIAWLKGSKIHDMLTFPGRSDAHLLEIKKLINDYPALDGVDIDYEGKWVEDKDLFSDFIRKLSQILHEKGKILSCTVEPRTSDTHNYSVDTKITNMPWANDYAVLNEVCDQVRLMTYDQSYFAYGATKWTAKTHMNYKLLSNMKWIREVLTYTKKHIAKEKIYLGIPTYGYRYAVRKKNGVYEYQNKGAYTYTRAKEKWPKMKLNRFLNDPSGDGYYHIEKVNGWNHYLVIADAFSIKNKMNIAKEEGIKGVYLFSAFGKEDEAIWK